MSKAKERPVIVCTEFRGVLDTSGDVARMAIYWDTTRGVMELAEAGPNSRSKISARADIEVRKVTAVFEVTPRELQRIIRAVANAAADAKALELEEE